MKLSFSPLTNVDGNQDASGSNLTLGGKLRTSTQGYRIFLSTSFKLIDQILNCMQNVGHAYVNIVIFQNVSLRTSSSSAGVNEV